MTKKVAPSTTARKSSTFYSCKFYSWFRFKRKDRLTNLINKVFIGVNKLSITILSLLVLFCYLLIFFSYCAAHYYGLAGLIFVSTFSVVVFVRKGVKNVYQENAAYIVLVYIPMLNVVVKDVFFLYQNNHSISNILLHSHYILLIIIAISGFFSNSRRVLIVGALSVAWIWIFTFISNDSSLWYILLMDTALFIIFSALIYFFNVSIKSSLAHIDKSNKVIRYQNEELKKILDIKVKMFNMLVHDIKNPINRILFASNHKVISKVEIVEPSMYILQILDDLLDLNKLGEVKQHVRKSAAHFNGIIEKAIDQTHYLLNEKNLKINWTSDAKIAIETDVNLIERILINILTNAIKYSKINDTIEIQMHDLNNNKVRIDVIDKGIGILPELVESIFDSRQQVKSEDFAYIQSSGLGLSFCKQAILSHGGTIGAISEIDKGTTIWFELPSIPASEPMEDFKTLFLKEELNVCAQEAEAYQFFKKELSRLAVYQSGKILSVRGFSDFGTYPTLDKWKNEVFSASLTGNEDYFRRLLQ